MNSIFAILLAAQIYVAPNVVQVRSLDISTSFAVTNTTKYWFNPTIIFIDTQGRTVRQFAPLLKGHGTWQRSSVDYLPDDFSGSVWVVSAQPIVGIAIIHQLRERDRLTYLGGCKLELVPDAD